MEDSSPGSIGKLQSQFVRGRLTCGSCIAHDLSRGGADDSTKETEALRARGKAAAGADGGEPGVGAGFCA